MTLLLADMATYQGTLTVAELKLAGFHIVNFKVSHGLTLRAVRAALPLEVAAARGMGLGVSGFHFLTGDTSGAAQATYAHQRLQEAGLATDAVHVVDVEINAAGPDATLSILREYLTTMQALLQRPVMVYTGNWWWKPRGWDVSDLTPYLHAAPNAGYLGGYPGRHATVCCALSRTCQCPSSGRRC